MSTIRILLGIFCLIAIGRNAEPSSGVLRFERKESLKAKSLKTKAESLERLPRNTQHITRNTLVGIAQSQIGVKELTDRKSVV